MPIFFAISENTWDQNSPQPAHSAEAPPPGQEQDNRAFRLLRRSMIRIAEIRGISQRGCNRIKAPLRYSCQQQIDGLGNHLDMAVFVPSNTGDYSVEWTNLLAAPKVEGLEV